MSSLLLLIITFFIIILSSSWSFIPKTFGSGNTGNTGVSQRGTFTGDAFAPYNFDSNADETLTVVVDDTDVVITLGANFANVAAAASGISITGATIAVEGSFLKITSGTTGTSSTITIKSDSGSNAKALFGSGTSVTGKLYNSAFDDAACTALAPSTKLTIFPLTAMACAGAACTAADCCRRVPVGSTGLTCQSYLHCEHPTLNKGVAESCASVTSGTCTENPVNKEACCHNKELCSGIPTEATKGTYTGTFNDFDFSAATAGTYTGTFDDFDFSAATAGTYTGTFAPFNFQASNQNLVLKVDSGSAVTKALTANCNTVAACITALGGASGITGATITEVSGKIMIKSTSTGTSSAIDIDASSGADAKLLFTNSATFCEDYGNGLIAAAADTSCSGKTCTKKNDATTCCKTRQCVPTGDWKTTGSNILYKYCISNSFITFKILCQGCANAWFAFGVASKIDAPSTTTPFKDSDVAICQQQTSTEISNVLDSLPQETATYVGTCDVAVGLMTFSRKLDVAGIDIDETAEIYLRTAQGKTSESTLTEDSIAVKAVTYAVTLKPTYCISIPNVETFCADETSVYLSQLIDSNATVKCKKETCESKTDKATCCKLKVVKVVPQEKLPFQDALSQGNVLICDSILYLMQALIIMVVSFSK